jgi:squalene synthase HpnC
MIPVLYRLSYPAKFKNIRKTPEKSNPVPPGIIEIFHSLDYIMSPMDAATREAFRFCENLSRSHYENFPVASLLLPKEKRPFIAAVYAFARMADDMADEGSLTPAERVARLDSWQGSLDRCYEGNPEGPVFLAIAETARQTGLQKELLSDLLVAFRLDVVKIRFADFEEILEYCRYSANPIGRIVLTIFDDATPEKLLLSDNICTGLQLANFWQDVSVDWKKGRVYLPLDDLRHFGYTETDLAAGRMTPELRGLMEFQVRRARGYLEAGRPLVRLARKELRFELNITVRGGLEILAAVEKQGFDVISRRPVLSAMTKLRLLGRALLEGGS